MSDYGDIGYLPTKSAEDSCYSTVRDCQLAIVIVGKRYGEKSQNGLSVTQNEFLSIKEKNIPLISIVDQEVMSYKRVYEVNKDSKNIPSFPGMDSAADTFSFISSIMDSPINNGIITFITASDARKNLKSQIAHIFHELLVNKFNPLNIHIQDVLSEVKTLRYELLKDKGREPLVYLYTMKWLLDSRDHGKHYADFAKSIYGSIDVAVPIIIKSSSFDEFIHKADCSIEISSETPDISAFREEGIPYSFSMFQINPYQNNNDVGHGFIIVHHDNVILMNTDAKKYFDFLHQELLRYIKKEGDLTKRSTGLAEARVGCADEGSASFER